MHLIYVVLLAMRNLSVNLEIVPPTVTLAKNLPMFVLEPIFLVKVSVKLWQVQSDPNFSFFSLLVKSLLISLPCLSLNGILSA